YNYWGFNLSLVCLPILNDEVKGQLICPKPRKPPAAVKAEVPSSRPGSEWVRSTSSQFASSPACPNFSISKRSGSRIGGTRRPTSLPDVGIKPKYKSTSLRRRPSSKREPTPSRRCSFLTCKAMLHSIGEITRRHSKNC